MNNKDILTISAKPDQIKINKNELAARLGTSREYESYAVDFCRERLLEVISYKCAYIKADIDLSKQNISDFGFMTVSSQNLYRNLKGCDKAFIMAVTAGIGVDRLLAKLNITSQAEHFITNALASAAIESFCDYASDIIKNGADCAPRFSPGYGDVSIEVQKPLLNRLNASQTLGITLNGSFFMTPVKSITAIMGVKNEKDN